MKAQFLYSLFLLVGIAALPCFSQKQYQLAAKGSAFLRPEVKRIYGKTTADSTGARQFAGKLLTDLQLKGYLNARIDSLAFGADTATVFFQEGKLFKVVLLANDPFQPTLKKAFVQSRAPISIVELNKQAESLLSYYENIGYPFASVYLDSVKLGQDTASGVLKVEKGPAITYDTLTVVGTARVNSRFLQTYLGAKLGHIYQENTVTAINSRLRELTYLKVLRTPEITFSQQGARVTVFADQRNANQFDGILGIQQNPVDNKVQLVGNLKLLLQNAFKGGELVDLNYQGLQQKSQLLEIKSEIPNVFQTDFGLSPSFKLFKQDTSFLNLNLKLGINYLFNGRSAIQFFVERQSTSLIASAVDENATTLPSILDANTLFYGLGLNIERLDYRFNPRKGYSLNINGSVGNKTIQRNALFDAQLYDTIPLKSTAYRLLLRADGYLPLGKRVVLALSSETGVLQSEYTVDNELFRIGGQRSLRGFNELSILANRYSMGNLEMRYILSQNSFLFAFYNQAFVQQKTAKINTTDFPLGFGTGMNIETQLGILSISYALGKQKNIPLNLRQGKIHFGIIALF